MPHALSRILQWIGALALAVALKWLVDELLWDPVAGLLDRTTDFERAELITGVLSYFVPLAAAALAYLTLFVRHPVDDGTPTLRKHPWQSGRLIAAVAIVVVALIAGTSYGRVFRLPQVRLPSTALSG